MNKLEEFEKRINYTFKNKKLLRTALTHKSAEYEHRVRNVNNYNERVEFLGDAILEHIISIKLYKETPSLTEGEMTKFRASIVCERSLSDVMRRLDISKYMNIGRCEEATNGRDKDAILADMFEAVLGAVYLDSDFITAEKYCLALLDNTYEDVINGRGLFSDYKTKLQELYQSKGCKNIEYRVVNTEGPDHAKIYNVELYVEDKLLGNGSGKNKKEAEQQAARKALQGSNEEN